MTTHAHCLIA